MVIIVGPEGDYTPYVRVTDDKERILDMKPYLCKGVFRVLQYPETFVSACPILGSIRRTNEANLRPDTLYIYGVNTIENH